jgi:hypothetical protein
MEMMVSGIRGERLTVLFQNRSLQLVNGEYRSDYGCQIGDGRYLQVTTKMMNASLVAKMLRSEDSIEPTAASDSLLRMPSAE